MNDDQVKVGQVQPHQVIASRARGAVAAVTDGGEAKDDAGKESELVAGPSSHHWQVASLATVGDNGERRGSWWSVGTRQQVTGAATAGAVVSVRADVGMTRGLAGQAEL